MRPRLPRPLLTAAAFFVFVPAAAATARAQTTIPTLPGGGRPSPEQAQTLLQSRPDLVQQLQQRLRTSGLTPDQVRSRLRAEGYPESLLDAYLPGGSGRGTAGDTVSNGTLLNAIDLLGIADSTDLSILRGDSTGTTARDRRGGARRGPVPTGARDFLIDTVVRARGARLPDTTGTGVRYVPIGPDSSRYLRIAPRRDPRDSTFGDDTSRFARDSARAVRDSGLAIFGLDLFQNANTTLFDPNLAGPVDENYRLGPGDRLVLILTGDVEQSQSLQVTREGFVVIPQVGQLFVNNLTLGQFERVLGGRLGRVYSGVRSGATRYSVSVARLRTNQVFVVGDVARPGSYRVSSAGTALTALYAAGGPTESGSLRRVEIRRGGRTVDVLDVYDYLTRGDASRDARLESGDVVFVPPRLARVRALGEVLRPGTYELRPGETLADLVRTVGGFTALAASQRLTIERVVPAAQRTPGARDRVVLDAAVGPGGGAPALPLVNGDVVRVARIATRVGNRIAVRGNVQTPGDVGFRPGLLLSDALRAAGGLKPDTYLGRVLVTRLERDSSRVQLRAILRDLSGAVVNDFPLREDDEIETFSVASFRPERSVSIGGAVRDGGRFQYRAGMTLRDLVLLAGGLTESALLTQAEVARLPADRTGGVTATTLRVALDSTYLFERDPGRGESRVPGVPAAASGAPDVALQPYDNVLILRQPDFELQRTVFLGGEVRFPGRYALRRKTERLSEIVARAGGLTSEGYADGVVFYRTRENTGRVGIDLPGVLRDARARDNFILQDGDSVVVPAYNPVVRVFGAVNAPGAVAFEPRRNLDFYVRAGGGPARDAEAGRAYVRQPNGKVQAVRRRRFLPDDVPEVRAGATVFVPTRSAADGASNFAQTFGVIAQLIGVLATVATTIVVVRNNR